MASTTETGHHKNVAAYENVISACMGFGAAYNPIKDNLKLTALSQQLAAVQDAMKNADSCKTDYDNATNQREVVVTPLKSLVRKVINALTVTGALPQTIDDARTIANKILGNRAKKVEQPTETELAAGAVRVKTNSTSQQSFDSLVDRFSKLILILAAEPKYMPNENELKLATLNTMLTDLRAKNSAVINLGTALTNARHKRNQLLYADQTGMVAVAQEIKIYVKSVYGAQSHEYKQLTAQQFYKPKAD